MKILLISDPDT